MLQFRSMGSLQRFVSVHASIYNHFNSERRLISRDFYKERRQAALICGAVLVIFYPISKTAYRNMMADLRPDEQAGKSE